MLKNKNKRDNLFILTNVINVSEQIEEILVVGRISWIMLTPTKINSKLLKSHATF